MANYGLLQAIQPPTVVAQLPVVQPTDNLNSLAGGIMTGLQQGQSIRESNQRMKQSAALFPGQQEIQKQTIDQNNLAIQGANIDLTDKKRAEAELIDRKNASAKSEADWLKVVAQQDPATAIKYQQDKANYEQTVTVTAEHMADAQKKGIDTHYSLAEGGGNLASTAIAMATDHQSGQVDWQKANAAYVQQLQTLPPELAKIYPKQLDPNSAMFLIKTGTDAHNKLLQDQLDKQPDSRTTEQKNAEDLARLDTKEKNGTLTPLEKAKKERLEQLTDKDGTSLQKSQSLVDSLQTDYDSFKNKNTPEAKRAKEKLDQAKLVVQKQTDLPINTKISNSAGNIVGGIMDWAKSKIPGSKSYTLNGRPFDMEAAKKSTGLSEEEIVKQAGLK